MYRPSDSLRSAQHAEKSASASTNYRTAFRKDYGRLLHSAAFRRLQGKTQLFPGVDSEFFRNRLTHSLEVAQIAVCIARRLNREVLENDKQVDEDLVSFAALAHDLGHPPFGHEGEQQLNKLMWGHGGFEGNAQTLRILSHLEEKVIEQSGANHVSRGLNLTYRSLASILKYDREIQPVGETAKVIKGYYVEERELVAAIKSSVAPDLQPGESFRTIECSIMDLADDIAYSTYDLEDSFRAGFLSPLDMLLGEERLLEEVVQETNKALAKEGLIATSVQEVTEVLTELVAATQAFPKKPYEIPENPKLKVDGTVLAAAYHAQASRLVCDDDARRTAFTSSLVGRFVNAVKLDVDNASPARSVASFGRDDRLRVEVLKNLSFCTIINSHRLRVVAVRGHEIVRTVFCEIVEHPQLLPDRWWRRYLALPEGSQARWRLICDFVACLTDRSAVDIYARLKSEEHRTIFKPLH